jgi:hypothetical protein
VNEAIAGRHATLWSFRHTFALTCVRAVVIVGSSAADVHPDSTGPVSSFPSEIGQFMLEGEDEIGRR